MSVRRRFAALVAAGVLLAALGPAPALAVSITGVDIQLPLGLTVSGRVVDDNGAGVPFASVGLCAGADDCFVVDGLADASGNYTIRGVNPGTFLAAATRPDAAQNLLERAYYAVGGSVTDPALASEITVGPAGLTGIDITLPSGLVLRGRTLDSNGDPVAGVIVDAFGDSAGGVPGTSDSTGAYRVVGLAPNSAYELFVEPPGDGPFPSGAVGSGMVTVPEDDGTRVSVGDTNPADVDITLTRGNLISGHLDGTSGAPIGIEVLGDVNNHEGSVDVSGDFEIRGVWPGTYRLLFVAQGEPEDSQFPYGLYNGQGEILASQNDPGVEVDASSADVTGLSAVAPGLPTISGVVSGESGPLSAARVIACDPNAGCAFATAPGGAFEFVNLPPGEYTILAGSHGRVPSYYSTSGSTPDPGGATPVHVDKSSVTGVDIVLPLGSSIAGRITGPSGEPVVGAFVTALPSSGGLSELGPGGAETDANGEYLITGLVDDAYQVSVNPPLHSGYKYGYWSESGYTDDFSQAGQITIASAPRIVSATPAAGATGVPRGASISLTLSTDVTGLSKATFRVREVRTHRLIGGKVAYSTQTDIATFDPTAPLGRRTTYEVSVLQGITDLAGNPLEPTSWTFTTGP